MTSKLFQDHLQRNYLHRIDSFRIEKSIHDSPDRDTQRTVSSMRIRRSPIAPDSGPRQTDRSLALVEITVLTSSR